MMANQSGCKEEIESGGESCACPTGTENERLQAELAREHELFLRTLADFDNYRRREERERATSARAGKRELVLLMLDVMDDYDRALAHMGDVPEWMSKGFVAIYKRLSGILLSQGVVPYESVGEPFDPVRHEASGMTESPDVAPGTVVTELSRGYRWGEEWLRPARVRVSR
jgi:molecular chaperone GrpE